MRYPPVFRLRYRLLTANYSQLFRLLPACCPFVNGRSLRCGRFFILSLFLLCFAFVFGNDPTGKRHTIPPVFNCCHAVGCPSLLPLLFRCCVVAVSLLEWPRNRPLFPLCCRLDRSPCAVCCFVVFSSYSQGLPIARRYPVLTPKNSRFITPRFMGYDT